MYMNYTCCECIVLFFKSDLFMGFIGYFLKVSCMADMVFEGNMCCLLYTDPFKGKHNTRAQHLNFIL